VSDITTDRLFSFPIGRVESPRRDLIVVTYSDGTNLDEEPVFETVELFRAALNTALTSWIQTKVGAAAYAVRGNSINVGHLAELLGSRRERPSLIERLKQNGINYLDVIAYNDRDIVKNWSIDDNLVAVNEK